MNMATEGLANPLNEGLKELYAGNAKQALVLFEKAAAEDNSPLVRSYIAYCRAKTAGRFHEAVAICMDARKEEPKNSDIYLNLGRVHLLTGNRKQAIQVFRLGLRHSRNSRIVSELTALGLRKKPPLPFLQRSNPVNKFLGKLMTKLWLR